MTQMIKLTSNAEGTIPVYVNKDQVVALYQLENNETQIVFNNDCYVQVRENMDQIASMINFGVEPY